MMPATRHSRFLAAATAPAIALAFAQPLSGGGPAGPEAPGWFAGDPHVHLDCGVGSGHDPVAPEDVVSAMAHHDLSVVSLLADMGNGEVREAERDLPLVDGGDHPASTGNRLLHWDAEWHFDPAGVTFEEKVIGGHLILLGLQQARRLSAEHTFPVLQWARQQGAIVGFAHMQYLDDDIPETLSCCLPLEYPVEVALGSVDFLMEDVWRNEAALEAYGRLLNCGFRPGLAAGTDFPCNNREPVGTLLTYVSIPDGPLTYRGWIEGIARGRTVISGNGHEKFLDLKVDGEQGRSGVDGAGGVGLHRNAGCRGPHGRRLVGQGAVLHVEASRAGTGPHGHAAHGARRTALSEVRKGGSSQPLRVVRVKGRDYAMVAADGAPSQSFEASYSAPAGGETP